MIASARRRTSFAAMQLAVALACAAAAACTIRPAAPSPGTDVKVTFTEPHGINVRPDSVLVVSELSGRLVAVRGDTIVLRLTRVPGRGNTAAWGGHEVTFNRDSTTKIERTSFDGSLTSLAVLAGIGLFAVTLLRGAHY